MALTQISTQGIKDGTITGSDLATNIDLVDNQKLRLGTGEDLQIYHDGTHSRIYNGTNDLVIRTPETMAFQGSNAENRIVSLKDGAVELYFNGNKKFETISNGCTITGRLNVTDTVSPLQINLTDNRRLKLGDNDDLHIYHDGSNSYIKQVSSATGDLLIFSDGHDIEFITQSGGHSAKMIPNGAVELYFDNTLRFLTNSIGAQCQGDFSIPLDNEQLRIGAGNDLRAYHTGSNSVISNATGELRIAGDDVRLMKADQAEHYFVGFANSYTAMYFDNSKKFETTSNGVAVNGQMYSNSAQIVGAAGGDAVLDLFSDGGSQNADKVRLRQTHVGNSFLIESFASGSYQSILKGTDARAIELHHQGSKKFETTANGTHHSGTIHTVTGDFYPSNDNNDRLGLSNRRWSQVQGYEFNIAEFAKFFDNIPAKFGNGDDLQIYHDGSNSFIDDVGTGRLRIRGNDAVHIRSQAENEEMAVFNRNGSVDLYHNNNKKLATTSSGITVTGTVTETSDIALKFNIQPLTNTLEKIQQITGYKYNLVDSISPSMGVIAQDVEKVFPELVHGSEGKKTLQYSGLIGVLVEAMKDLSAKVAALEAS